MKFLKVTIPLIFVILLIWILYLFVFPNIKRKQILLPDLSQFSIIHAKSFLDENDIKYKIIEDDYSEIPRIKRTVPKSNTYVKQGSSIKIYVSAQKNSVLNDYTNTLYQDSHEEILNYSIIKGYKIDLKYEIRNDIMDGIIINQEEKNGVIYITLSKSEDLYLKNYIGYNVVDIIKEIEGLNISFNYIPSFVDFNIIIKQSVYNKYICKNNESEIIFYVSRGI